MGKEKIKLLLMSLGGTPDPLVKSILTYSPDKVIFFASHDSVPLSYTILSATEKKPVSEFVITENPNSLYECYSKARECIDRVGKADVSSSDVIVDYTGGTKVMTAALLIASLGRSYRFNYVGGLLREKNGLGSVAKGHEKMFSEASPWVIFAEEERRQVVTLFNCRRFSAVIEILNSFDREMPTKISDYFEMLLPIAKGFLFWDQFNHKSAQRNLAKGVRSLEKYIGVYKTNDLEPFLEELKTCMKHLDDLIVRTDGLQKYDMVLVKDLLNNARRKMADKRLDDAAARIYRALELYGQIIFKQVAKCDNSKVKPDVIPDNLREDFKKKYYDSYTKHLKLPLTATFEYLRSMGHEAGNKFFTQKKEIKKIQSNRNFSILAHGIKPVSEKAAESIFTTVSNFVAESEFFDFPELP